MKICLDCWHVFEDDEVATWREYVGECWGRPAYEPTSGCPKCHGDYVKAKKCEKCGEYVPDYELDDDGICDKCNEDQET